MGEGLKACTLRAFARNGKRLAAIDIHRLNRLSFWDSMVVEAARVSGCSILFSEDLNAGQTIAGVKIVNPFV